MRTPLTLGLTLKEYHIVEFAMTGGGLPTIACEDSVGGEDGTEFNLGGLWPNSSKCIIFKG